MRKIITKIFVLMIVMFIMFVNISALYETKAAPADYSRYKIYVTP